LSLNINLNAEETEVFYDNIVKISTHLYKISKNKYLHVFNKLAFEDPGMFKLATCQNG